MVHTLHAYCKGHMSVWNEVEDLRDRELKDLIASVASCVAGSQRDSSDGSQTLSLAALQLFNTLTEHSWALTTHASSLERLNKFVNLAAGTGHDQQDSEQHLEFKTECGRACLHMLRVPQEPWRTDQQLEETLWRLLCSWLSDPHCTIDSPHVDVSLQIITECHSMHRALVQLCKADWCSRGSTILQRLFDFASAVEWRDEAALARSKCAIQAIRVLVSSNDNAVRLLDDQELVAGLLANLVSSSPLYGERTQLVTEVISLVMDVSADTHYAQDPHVLVRHILDRYERLHSVPMAERAAYLELVPVLLSHTCTRRELHVPASTWKAILEHAIYFLEHGVRREFTAAQAAIAVYLQSGERTRAVGEVLPVLKRIWMQLQRSLENGICALTQSSEFVSFVSQPSQSKRESVEIASGQSISRRRSSGEGEACNPLRSICDVRKTVAAVFQLGRLLSPRSSETRCAQVCISLLVTQAYYADSDTAGAEVSSLTELLWDIVSSGSVFEHSGTLWVSQEHFDAFSRWLLRSVVAVEPSSHQHFVSLSLVAKMLEGESVATTSVPSDTFSIQRALNAAKVDVIDVVWWSVFTAPTPNTPLKNAVALWSDVLRLTCKDVASSGRLLATRIAHELVWETMTACNRAPMLCGAANVSLLELLRSLCRISDDATSAFLRDNARLFKLVTDHCIRTVALLAVDHPVQLIAIEVLSVAVQDEKLAKRAVRTCCLQRSLDTKRDRKTRQTLLRGLSGAILLCQNNIVALEQALRVIDQLAQSEAGVDALIYARQGTSKSMVDVLDFALQSTVGTSRLLELRTERALSLTFDLQFLPPAPSPYPHLSACRLALALLERCVANITFSATMQHEVGIFCELFAAIGCPDWAITTSAASIVTKCLRWPYFDPVDDDDEQETNGDTGAPEYLCSLEPSEPNQYRRLAFFANLNEQRVFETSAGSADLPSSFALLAIWVRFYSKNLQLLQANRQVRNEKPHSGDETPRDAPHAVVSRYEQHLLDMLEILLYLLVNYFGVVYDVSGDDPAPEERAHHAGLCLDLLEFCTRVTLNEQHSPLVASDVVRTKALTLLRVLCSSELSEYSDGIFTREGTIDRLLTVIETTHSAREQQAAAHLLFGVTSSPGVKGLFVAHQTLFLRICSWLENPRLDVLQHFAIGTLKNLATKSLVLRRQSLFAFAPSFQEQLARLLFQGKQFGRKTSIQRYTIPRLTMAHTACVTFCHRHLEGNQRSSVYDSTPACPVQVKVLVRIVRGDPLLRQERVFQLRFELGSVEERVSREIALDKVDRLLICVIETSWRDALSERRLKTKHSMTHTIRVNDIRELSDTSTALTAATIAIPSGFVDATLSSNMVEQSADGSGAIGRLLRHEDIEPAILADGASIVAELCRNRVIFCDDEIKLWDHVLAVMSAHARVRTPTHESEQLALACLQNLSTWFWSDPSVKFFKASMKPLLQLLQGMRHHELGLSGAVLPTLTASASSRDSKRTHGWDAQSGPNFLTGLVEWIAAIETPLITENFLSALFFENTDTLLFLSARLFPARSPRSSFFSLVAAAVRSNMVHCEVFARKHSLQQLVRMLGTPSERDTDSSYAQTLASAARVIAKLCRHATSRNKFLRHGGLQFYGRVAFEVFRFEWQQRAFPREAGENLVLGASFLCDFVTHRVFLDPNDPLEMRWMGLLATRNVDEAHLDATTQSSLSVLETLLHFLGCAPEHFAASREVTRLLDSFDRLAARVAASLVEKHPRRNTVERSVLELVSHFSGDERGGTDRVAMRRTFIVGLERCIALTKWDFDSDLNALRWTYYAGICGGVRTGVIPPQCRNVFVQFDRDFLVPGTEQLSSSASSPSSRDATSRSAHTTRYTVNDALDEESDVVDSSSARESIEAELKEVLVFVAEHDELVATLAENRKKHLANSIRVGDRNSRVLLACHSVLSLALDFYVDMVAVIQGEMNEARFERSHVLHHGNAGRIAAIHEWLVLLEELSSLVCCALHELDASYYSSHLHQVYSLVTELPAFLRKMERVQSRTHTCLLFVKNLNSFLKRIANKNELKAVTGSGFGVAEEAKKVCERLQQLESEVSEALAYVLSSKSMHTRLERLLVAMEYMWKRTLGSSTSVSTFMSGATRPTETLWATLKRQSAAVLAVLADPLPLLVAHWRKAYAVLKTLLAHEQHSEGIRSSEAALETTEDNDNNVTVSITSQDGVVDRDTTSNTSNFPFCSLESLLDHFGYASLRSKKIKQMMAVPPLRHDVLHLLARVFAIDPSAVERLSVLQMESRFHELSPAEADLAFRQLHTLLDDADAGIQLRFVKTVPLDVTLWRFLVRPIQRVRLYRLYFLVIDFLTADVATQHRRLSSCQVAEGNRFSSHWDMPSSLVHDDLEVNSPHARSSEGPTAASLEPSWLVKKKPLTRGRKKTLLEFFTPSDLKLRIGAIADDSPLSHLHRRSPASACIALFDASTLRVCDSASITDPLSEAMAVHKLRRALRAKKERIRRSVWSRVWLRILQSPLYRKYVPRDSRMDGLVARVTRRLQLFVLFVAFWRQEELAADLSNDLLAKAFDSRAERDAYFLSYHIRKAAAEFARVWMPESGNLGLRLWQAHGYLVSGTLASILVSYALPSVVGANAWERHWFMEYVIYAYVGFIFFLSALSIFVIARSTFVTLSVLLA